MLNICHGNRQHDGEEAVVFAELGTNGEENTPKVVVF